jgi:glycosyltransferase involved in cell wall biosynthesis
MVKQVSRHARVRVIAQINTQWDKTIWERTWEKGEAEWWWWPKKPYNYGLWSSLTFYSDKPAFRRAEKDPEVWLVNLSEKEKKLIYRFYKKGKERQDQMIGVLSQMFERKIRRLVNRGDVIHCVNGGFSYLYHAALRVGKKLDIPVVFTPILHLYHFGWEEDLKKARENNQAFEYVPAIHYFDTEENRLSERYIDAYWQRMCRNADCITTLTEFEREFLIRLGYDGSKIETVGCGPVLSNHNDIDIRKKFRIPEGPIVLFVGRNHESKGLPEILEAAGMVWAEKPDVNFLFIGPHESNAPYLFNKLKNPRLWTPGVLGQAEKTAAFRACDLLCLPSLHESLGIAYLEAWMFEKPIIAADIPQVRELTEGGRGGLLVNPVPDEIAKGILQILNDRERAAEMGRWGKNRVMTRFNWDVVYEKLMRAYQKII